MGAEHKKSIVFSTLYAKNELWRTAANRGVVPVERIELPTNGLQNRCSTAELNRQLPAATTSAGWGDAVVRYQSCLARAIARSKWLATPLFGSVSATGVAVRDGIGQSVHEPATTPAAPHR